jgi:hypothetical protein
VHSPGSPQQAFAIRVFADLDEDLPNGTFYALLGAPDFAIFDGFGAGRLLGALHLFAAVTTLDLLDYLADVSLEIETVVFQGLVGGHE